MAAPGSEIQSVFLPLASSDHDHPSSLPPYGIAPRLLCHLLAWPTLARLDQGTPRDDGERLGSFTRRWTRKVSYPPPQVPSETYSATPCSMASTLMSRPVDQGDNLYPCDAHDMIGCRRDRSLAITPSSRWIATKPQTIRTNLLQSSRLPQHLRVRSYTKRVEAMEPSMYTGVPHNS